jgi:hypothetical protein
VFNVPNTMIAFGPSFKQSFKDMLPTGNVDLAPTIAHILGLNMDNTDGRVLYEALNGHNPDYTVKPYQVTTKTVDNLKFQSAADPSGKTIIPNKSKYKTVLSIKALNTKMATYQYFDEAKTI